MEMAVSVEFGRPLEVTLYPADPEYHFDFSTQLDRITTAGFVRCTLCFDGFEYYGNTSAYAIVYGYFNGTRIFLRGSAVPASRFQASTLPANWNAVSFSANCTISAEPVQGPKPLYNDPLFIDPQAMVIIATGSMINYPPGNYLVSPVIYNVIPATSLKDAAIPITPIASNEPYQVFCDYRLGKAIRDESAPGPGPLPTRLYPRTAKGTWDHDIYYVYNLTPNRGYHYTDIWSNIDTTPQPSQAQGQSGYAVADSLGRLPIPAGVVSIIGTTSIKWQSGNWGNPTPTIYPAA
jgi:hypothetical protein